MRKDSADSFHSLQEDPEQIEKMLTPELTLFLMECGYINILNYGTIEKAIVLIGNTKAGKTTLLHTMAHSDLVGAHNDFGRVVYKTREVSGTKVADALIGDRERHSETQIPNIVNIQIVKQGNKEEVCVVDFPGFLDSYGCYRSISNRFFMRAVFSKIKKIKFVIVTAYNDLEKLAKNFVTTIESFFKLFKNHNQKIEQIAKYVSLVVTAVPPQVDEKMLTKLISKVKMTKQSVKKSFHKLMKELGNNKIFKFESAVLDRQISKDLNLQNRINQSITGWYQITDMKDFRVTITDALNFTQDQSFMKQLQPFSECIKSKFNSTFKDILHDKMLEDFIANAGNQKGVYYGELEVNKELKFSNKFEENQYKSLEQKYKKKRQSQNTKLYEQMTIKNSKDKENSQKSVKQIVFIIQKLRGFKRLSEICFKIHENDSQYKKQLFLDSLREILTIFLQLLRKKSQATEKMKIFTFQLLIKFKLFVEVYEIFRTSSDEAGFFQGKGRTLPPQLYYLVCQLPTKMNQIFIFEKFSYISLSIKFLKSLKLSEIPNKLQVYQKYLSFIQQLVNKILTASDNELEEEKIQPKNKQSVLDQLNQMQSFFELKILQWRVYNESSEKSEKIMESLQAKRKQNSEKSSKYIDDQEKYFCNVMKITHLMCYQAKKENKIDLLPDLYEALNDGYSVIQIFKQKEEALDRGFDLKNQKQKEEMLKLLKIFMEKAFKFDRIQLAIEKGQRAYSLAQNIGDQDSIRDITKFLRIISPSFSYQTNHGQYIDMLFQKRKEYQFTMQQSFTLVDIQQDKIKMLLNKKE